MTFIVKDGGFSFVRKILQKNQPKSAILNFNFSVNYHNGKVKLTFKRFNRVSRYQKMLLKSRMHGKKMSAGAQDSQNVGQMKSGGLTIDHVIIFIVVIVLSITIFNTYFSVSPH
ncbi:MAG: hypothetical protein C4518_15310 [Desulfobacteraceae bacterium]|nr:MAG: hypothetical protein C4518_15310 [Desulfobacteraceae bacterium]